MAKPALSEIGSRVILRPSGRVAEACQPSSVSARVGSIVIAWTSPVRGGANSGSKEVSSSRRGRNGSPLGVETVVYRASKK